ncbi:MAG: transglutaminase domain-containing protein, partial [Cyanobacteria bacterium P01_F01_bin.42]
QTPLEAFLLDHRSGHCEYFASATALLLRSTGIPARYVAGYSVSEFSPAEQQYIGRVRDAHAWVMAYVDGAWRTIDTTPSGGASRERNGQETLEETIAQSTPAIAPELQGIGESSFGSADAREGQELFRQERFNEENRPSLIETVSEKGDSVWELIKEKASEAWAFVKAQFNQVSESLWFGSFMVMGVAIPLIAIFLIWRMYRRPGRRGRRSRKRRFSFRQSEAQTIEYTFHHIEARLESLNLQRAESETPMRWAARLEQALPRSQFNDLKPILDLHYRDRFDPEGINREERQQFQALIHDWLINFEERKTSSAILRGASRT